MKQALAKLDRWWERYSKGIRLVFVLSVIVFVVHALGSFFKQVNWHEVHVGLTNLSWSSIILLTICGCIAVSPMLGYDFAITRFLPGKFRPSYIVKSGWITNTLTNIAGFGGLLGASLRAYFYRENATKKQIAVALSKIAVFLLSGLSVVCWLALIVMFLSPATSHFRHYTIWLVGGGCYFPILLYFTQVNDNKLFHSLSGRLEALIIGSSTAEWLFVSGFFILVGFCLGISGEKLVAAFPLYIVAELLGIISMIPGALGSFDVMMMLELTLLGVPKSTAVIWLLLFRLFYYIVPVAIAGLLFMHNVASGVNSFFHGMPAQIGGKCAHFLITAFMYISGFMLLLVASLPDLTNNSRFLDWFYPMTFFFLHQLTTIVYAIALLVCARGLQNKLKSAYWPSLILLLIGVANTIWNLATWTTILYLIIILVLILMSNDELYRIQMQYSPGDLAIDILIFIGGALLYVIVGIINTPTYNLRHNLPSFLLFPGEHVWLSGLIGIILGIMLVMVMLRWFTRGYDPFKSVNSFDSKRVTAVIDKFGGNETSHLAFLRDKSLYFYQVDGEDQLFFMFRRHFNRLIVMGDPVGNQKYLRDALRQFVIESDQHGYQLVFYEVSPNITLLLHEFGFDFIKTGETGRVKLDQFTLAGKRQRSQRALMHKFDREGYQFDIIKPPFSDEQMKELKAVSDSWLGDSVEKGFSLGFFDRYYLNQAPISTVRDKDGKLVAFANLMPTGGKHLLTIDLMRHSKDAPSGIMDKIFVSLFLYGQKAGYEYFDLGMAPLSNVGEYQYSFIEEKIAHLIYEYGTHLYGFQGLRHYKNKYADKWEARYTAYRKKTSLVTSMASLVAVVNSRIDNPQQHRSMLWWTNQTD